jgi:hypothetical protein
MKSMLKKSLLSITLATLLMGCDTGSSTSQGNGNSNGKGHDADTKSTYDINAQPTSTLTQELKDAIAHMGNEERLAYDVYMNLYSFHKENNGIEIKQLYNIANNSEVTHVNMVQDVVRKYDLGADDLTNVEVGVADNTITFEAMPSGRYDIPKIQSLYDALYALGVDSQVDALMVGCMVEVTDINDLNEYIVLAENSNATDVLGTFDTLREGSYNHYWSFDSALKTLGVTQGCYVEGDPLLGENKEGIYPQD